MSNKWIYVHPSTIKDLEDRKVFLIYVQSYFFKGNGIGWPLFLLFTENKICTVIKLSSPQLVDNCTYGTTAFPCIKSSLPEVWIDDRGWSMKKYKI